MAVTIEQLTEQITASGLMTADEVTAFVDRLPDDQKPADAEALAKQLVKQKQLTPFQAEQIWKGEGKQLILGNYVITEKLGQGGMGMVLKASHRLMKRDVALKVLSPGAVKDATAVKRFLREVEAAAKLTHPNIVAAHDADQANGAYFLIMEYVEGRDLSQTVKKQGPATIEQAVDFILQAARGLEYAHQNGVVHRDIKPANLLLENTGTVKVLDMGLARIDDGGVDAATQAALTGTGTIMGTVDYMAPEQAEDTKSAGPQADIYSLGASLYYLLTGKSMVTGTAIGKKLKMLMTGEGLPDSMTGLRSEVSVELDAVFRKMTAFDMADRYQTMTEVIADLEAIKAGGASNSASTPGIQPVAGRSDDSAMQSFLNKQDDGTVTTGPTVAASPKVEISAETMSSSVDEATRPAFKKTATFTKSVTDPKNRKLAIGGAVAGCLLLGAVIWGLNRGEEQPSPLGDGSRPSDGSQISVADGTTPEVISVHENWALKFDGKTSHVRIPSLQYDGKTSLTMEAIVKIDANSSGVIISDVEKGGVVLYLSGGGAFRFEGYGHDQKFGIGSRLLSGVNRRVHVAAVYDGQQVRLFVDGELQESTAAVTRIQKSLFFFVIGTNLNGTAENPYPDSVFSDEIDEIRISNTARYDKSFQPPGPSDRFDPDEHTLALYHFDEGSGTILTDSSGNGHDGKIVGAKWVRVDAAPTNLELELAGKGSRIQIDTGDVTKRDRYTFEFFVTPLWTAEDPWPREETLAAAGPVLVEAHRSRRWSVGVPGLFLKSTSMTLGRRVHLALVRDDAKRRLYVDGKLVDDQEQGDTAHTPFESLRFGGEGQRLRLDEVRLSSVARYEQDFVPATRHEPDAHTLALYHCDEGSGTVLKDSSGNDHHGEIVDAKWVRVDQSSSSNLVAPLDLPDGEPGDALRIPYTVIRHPNSNHLGFLSDKLVLAASTNGTPTTFRLSDGALQRKLERAWFDGGKVGATRFAQSSNHLFGGLTDGRVAQWDIESGKIENYLGDRAEATEDHKIFSMSVASDGKSIAAAQPNGLVRVWDVETGRQIGSRQLEIQARCAFLPGSQQLGLLSGTQLAIWDVVNDRIEKTYPHGLAASTDFLISPDGRYAIACDGRRGTAFCLNLQTGDVRQFSSPAAPAYFSTISPNSRLLYAGGILYDLETLQPALDLSQEARGNPDSSWRLVTYAPDGRFLVVHVYSEEKSKQGIVFWRLPEKFWPRGTHSDIGVPPPADADRAAAEWILSIGGSLKTDADIDNSIKAIEELPRQPFRLSEIDLNGNRQVSDADLKHLQGLTDLVSIDLLGTQISDAGLESIKDVTSLEILRVPHLNSISNAGLKHIKELTKLENLTFSGTSIDNDGLRNLRGLTRIKQLRFSGTQISDAGLVHLKPLVNLDFLNLDYTKVSDAGLEYLKELTKLKHVRLRETKVTASGVAALQKALPNCSIDWDGTSAKAPPPANAPFNQAQAKAHQTAWADYLGLPVETTNSIGMKFILIPPGEFVMGAKSAEVQEALLAGGLDDRWEEFVRSEIPQHKVVLTQPFYLGVNEVTQAEYAKVMGTNSSRFASTGTEKEAVAGVETANHPVEEVNWIEAAEFCARLSQREQLKPFYWREGDTIKPLEGTGYRLPREAEWEFACRAGSVTYYSYGDDDKQFAEFGWSRLNSGERTQAVGTLKANAFGLFDMHGNVLEWVEDAWKPAHYEQFRDKVAMNPKGPSDVGLPRGLRGGHWNFLPFFARSSRRFALPLSYRGGNIGFRVVLTIDPAKLRPVADPKSQTINAPPPAKAPFNKAQAKAHQQAWADYLGELVEKEVELPGGARMTFMLIPPGEFMMGATVAEQKLFLEQTNADDDGFAVYDRTISEKNPLHLVRITQPFYFGKYEVTQREWQSVMKANPSRTKSPEIAVGGIAWNDVQSFLDKLNERPQLTGSRFALPTEAQWEYACRAGTTTNRHYGDSETALQEYGWFKANGGKDAHRVGQLRTNPFGLYDMYGNIYEWCADRYDVNYYLTSPVNDPLGPATGKNRIVRGGSWNHPPRHCNSPHRGFDLPDKPFVDHGLRLVLTIDTSKLKSAAQTDDANVDPTE